MKITVHLKIDTGMGRIGFNPGNAVSDAVRISEMEGIELKGLMSHFSEADLPDGKFSVRQLELFKMIKKDVQEKLGYSLMSHMANSGAVLLSMILCLTQFVLELCFMDILPVWTIADLSL